MKKTVNRRDVADAAGVSLTTVTHALNPKPGVRMNKETREKVRRIAAEMGYRPNFIGRALVTGKSFAAGLLQPRYESMFTDFYQHMAYGLAVAMGQDDYNLLLAFRDEQKGYLKTIRQGRVDGMVVLQSDFDISCIEKVIETGMPTVVLNRTFDASKFKSCANIAADHAGLMQIVMKSFADNKRKNILSINDTYCDPNQRLFDEFNRLSEELISDGVNAMNIVPSKSNFSAQIKNLFTSGKAWDAVYADGIEYIKPITEAAAEVGLKPGKDYDLHVSDVRAEDIVPEYDFPVSIYLQQPEEMGKAAWKALKALIDREEFEKQTLIPYIKVV
jgi:DNA-binding LacI/PurR family transcriptional regulator